MKVLVITGNPKKKGALATLTDEAERGAVDGGAEVEEIRLADMEIGHCRFCLKCREDIDSTVARCVQQDDMAGILEKVKQADGYIFSCPTSGGQVNALMKAFVERTTWTLGRPTRRILWVHGCPESRIADKRRHAVLLTTAGVVPTWSRVFCNGANRLMGQHASGLFNAKIAGRVYSGPIFERGLTEKDKSKAYSLGRALARKIELESG